MKKFFGLHCIYWILVYLAITMNGHIYRLGESGAVTRENGLDFVAGWEYIYLPILMAILLGWVAYVFSIKKFILPMIILGLLFSSYIHYDLLGIGHTLWVIILGILSFGIIRYLKQKKTTGLEAPVTVEER